MPKIIDLRDKIDQPALKITHKLIGLANSAEWITVSAEGSTDYIIKASKIIILSNNIVYLRYPDDTYLICKMTLNTGFI